MPDDTLIERIAHLVNAHASAKQVYADPVEREGTTIIPVARVQWGFGGGGLGHGALERGGGGGGVRAIPAGFIEVMNGEAQFRPYRSAADVAPIAIAAAAGVLVGVLLSRSLRR